MMNSNTQVDAAEAFSVKDVRPETKISEQALDGLKSKSPQVYEHLKKILNSQAGQLVLEIAPHRIRAGCLANRHPASFNSADFLDLQTSIKVRGGNTVPILVRPITDLDTVRNPNGLEEPLFEVIAGHRRHQACRGLGINVRAIVVPEMTDGEVARTMYDENSARIDITPFESGRMYSTWIERKLFSSQAKLAKALNKNPSDISRALVLARLPRLVLEAFESPLTLQLKDADDFRAILGGDSRTAVLRLAADLARLPKKKSRAEVIRLLKEASSDNSRVGSTNGPRKMEFLVEDQCVGSITWNEKGRGRVTLDRSLTTSAQIAFEEMLAALVKNTFSPAYTESASEATAP